jgi:hypothetical protein
MVVRPADDAAPQHCSTELASTEHELGDPRFEVESIGGRHDVQPSRPSSPIDRTFSITCQGLRRGWGVQNRPYS